MTGFFLGAIALIDSIAQKISGGRYWLEVLLLLIGLGGWGFGVVSWYGAAVRKTYAAEQDFRAIAQWMKQNLEAQKAMIHDQDRRFDFLDGEVREIKAIFQAILMARGDGNFSASHGRGNDFPG